MKLLSNHYVHQEFDWDCGIACFKMILLSLGQPLPEFSELQRILKTTELQGTDTQAMQEQILKLVAKFDNIKSISGENSCIENLQRLFAEDWLILICYREQKEGAGHFALVQGIAENEIILADPEHGPEHRIALSNFDWRTGFETPERVGWFVAIKS